MLALFTVLKPWHLRVDLPEPGCLLTLLRSQRPVPGCPSLPALLLFTGPHPTHHHVCDVLTWLLTLLRLQFPVLGPSLPGCLHHPALALTHRARLPRAQMPSSGSVPRPRICTDVFSRCLAPAPSTGPCPRVSSFLTYPGSDTPGWGTHMCGHPSLAVQALPTLGLPLSGHLLTLLEFHHSTPGHASTRLPVLLCRS